MIEDNIKSQVFVYRCLADWNKTNASISNMSETPIMIISCTYLK